MKIIVNIELNSMKPAKSIDDEISTLLFYSQVYWHIKLNVQFKIT